MFKRSIQIALLALAMISVRSLTSAAAEPAPVEPAAAGSSSDEVAPARPEGARERPSPAPAVEPGSGEVRARAADDSLLATTPLPETVDASAAPANPPEAEWMAMASGGEVALEARAFRPDHRASTKDFGIGLFSRLELKGEQKFLSFVARGYARADAEDQGRSLAVVERLFVDLKSSWLDLRVGADLFDWSATEAFHPADIINARNLDGEFERYEKIGEPMAALSLRWDTGSVSAYYFPYRSFPILPSRASRLNPFPEGATVGPFRVLDRKGELSDSRFAAQGALRLVQKLGTTDLSLHVVHQTDRSELEILVDPNSPELHPLLRHVTQFGGTVQTVLEPFVFKLEAAYRRFSQPRFDSALSALPNRDHLEVAAGVDYGWLWGSTDSTLYLESQQFLLTNEPRRQELSAFPHDVLLGYRLAVNDPSDTIFNASAIADTRQPQQMFFSFGADRRIWGGFRLNVAVRFATGIQQWTSLHIPVDYDHVRVSLARKF